MKFCDKKIQECLLNGGKIKRRIRPNAIVCIDPFDDMRIFAEKKCGNTEEYTFTKQDLIADDWEIIEPEYDWNKIIKDKIFCQFWDELEETDEPCFGYLTKKTTDGFYRNGWDCVWKFCKPFNPADYNIVTNLRSYEK